MNKITHDHLERVTLCAYQRGRKEDTLGQFADRVHRVLSSLQKLSPAFQQFYETGTRPNNVTPIAPDLSNLKSHLRKKLYDKKEMYSEMGPDGLPSINATTKLGFLCSFINQPKENRAGYPARTDVSFSSGIEGVVPGNVIIKFPFENYPEFYKTELQKFLFRAVVEQMQSDDGVIHQFRASEKVPQAEGDNIFIGTVNYFADKRVANALPEDIEREPLGDGVLVIVSRERPDPDNAKQIHDATRVRDALHAKGLLKYA
jgi:hypothetical protein